MNHLRKTLVAAVSGILMATAVSWMTPSAPAHAAPGDPNVGLAIVIEGQGNGHGRGLSQYGAVGWATVYGKDWTWILDHYYGDTSMGTIAAGTRMSVRLTAQDDLQTAVIAAGGNAFWVGGTPGYFRRWSLAKLGRLVDSTPTKCGARRELQNVRRQMIRWLVG